MNVTATSLVFFFRETREQKEERERVARVEMKRERERSEKEKRIKILLFGNSDRNRILKGIGPVKKR